MNPDFIDRELNKLQVAEDSIGRTNEALTQAKPQLEKFKTWLLRAQTVAPDFKTALVQRLLEKTNNFLSRLNSTDETTESTDV